MYQVISTTDGKFIGKKFTLDDGHNVVGLEDEPIQVTQHIALPGDMWRFANSNYSIDAETVEG